VTDLADFVALSLLPSWCWLRAAEQLRAGDSAAVALERILAQHWRDQPEKPASLSRMAHAAVERAQRGGIASVAWNDASYPASLTTIVDPPLVLWLRGSATALSTPSVAIVGARAATPYALSVAERLAIDLVACGVTIVSGLARGVDSAAHRGALTAGGITIGVLGSGVDVLYPREHAALARDIEKSGAIVSEAIPGTPPKPYLFPLRNRIIAGLSRAVVVIEAGEKSGSLITARCALEQGRDVLAVPGNVLSGRNRGGHALLRDGAKIVETAADILEELGMPAVCGSRRATLADPILACFTAGEPADLDAICEKSGLTPARLLPRLFELELQGMVARVGGGRFVRVDSSC
jgi:DNA processing protein